MRAADGFMLPLVQIGRLSPQVQVMAPLAYYGA